MRLFRENGRGKRILLRITLRSAFDGMKFLNFNNVAISGGLYFSPHPGDRYSFAGVYYVAGEKNGIQKRDKNFKHPSEAQCE